MQDMWCNGDYMSIVINFASFKKNTKTSTCIIENNTYINNNDTPLWVSFKLTC